MTTFERMARQALGGDDPWPWQVRLAEIEPPELLRIPTGCGKTAGVVLAWLYRRRFHSDGTVRSATPRRLVFVLPMRTLVEQTRDVVARWLANLGLDDADGVRLAVLMGGEQATDDWRLDLAEDTIVIGTLDMILSRTLNRGYGQSRYAWPIDFGLLNNDCSYVLDEVQLMGAARPTSRQLQAFRANWGTVAPVTSTWMSATLDPALLQTVDAPDTTEPFVLTESDNTQDLRARLEAKRTVQRWLDEHSRSADSGKDRAATLVREHRAGTLTIAVVNTKDAARKLYAAVEKLQPGAEVCLLHSQFRPQDRAELVRQVLSTPPPAGRIVCSTQVIEAGVDLSAATLFTEVAPWSSIVQRIGRCNRDGQTAGARVFWDDAARPEPYQEADLDVARNELTRLTGATVTTASLAAMNVVESGGQESQVLRRADFLRLFDTAADLSGNDIDISPFIRDGADLEVRLAWRTDLTTAANAQPDLHRDELCPVSLGDLATWRKDKALFRLDHLARSSRRWVPVSAGERILPGQVLLADTKAGGYVATTGWSPTSASPVVEAIEATAVAAPNVDLVRTDEQLIDDNGTATGAWVPLGQHLDDVEREVADLLGCLQYDLPARIASSAAIAGRWHDWGKAHPAFQTRLQSGKADVPPDLATMWAKSPSGRGEQRPADRRYFRHELASALALLAAPDELLGPDADRDLTAYLVAAHHGKVRLSLRSAPDEVGPGDGRRYALGVWDRDELPSVAVGNIIMPAVLLDLSPMDIGGTAERPSWVSRTADLVARDDLGPFRLGFLEALVRIADWRASTRYTTAAGGTR